VWVNNAVLAAVGRLEEVPPETNRRVVEANLLGYFYGAQATLPIFREQGSSVLINCPRASGSWVRPMRAPTRPRSSPSVPSPRP
jgi:NAD(P)-dependent dehydrogenase (short-subunit alcohol dehydrogenase family)